MPWQSPPGAANEREDSLPGHESQSFAADLSQPDGADSLYEAVLGAMGAPDVVVNNAGTIYREPAENHDSAGMDDCGPGKSEQRFPA